MLLAIDVGNTEIAAGVFDGGSLTASIRLHTEDRATGDELGLLLTGLLARQGVEAALIDSVAVSNVVPALSRALEEVCHRCFGCAPLVVGPELPTGLRILYDDPREVGADRIANALAALHLHGCPAILIDFGTATTFDALSAEGEYLGGAIAPGIAVSLDALVRHAARLNPVDLVAPPKAIGRTTTASVQAGLVLGHAAMVEGMVARMTAELGEGTRVIATGGLVRLMAPLIPAIAVVDENLTLTGLRLIHEHSG